MATKPKPKAGATATAVGKHLDISQQRVTQFADEGVFNRNEQGRYDLDACRVAYIRWLRDDQRRVTKAAGANRVSDARARKIELEIAREEHRIIDLEEHDAVVDELVGVFSRPSARSSASITDRISSCRFETPLPAGAMSTPLLANTRGSLLEGAELHADFVARVIADLRDEALRF